MILPLSVSLLGAELESIQIGQRLPPSASALFLSAAALFPTTKNVSMEQNVEPGGPPQYRSEAGVDFSCYKCDAKTVSGEGLSHPAQ